MIQYKVVKRKSPKTGEVIYHPAIAGVSVVSNQKIIERIEKKCTLASSDIKAVLDALEVELIDALRDGDAVRFGDLGSFRPTLRTKSQHEEKEVSVGDIAKVGVVFTPTLRVKQALDVKKGYVRFSKVEVVPVVKKKKAAHTEGAQPAAGGTAQPASSQPASSQPASAQPAAGDTHSEG